MSSTPVRLPRVTTTIHGTLRLVVSSVGKTVRIDGLAVTCP